MSEQAKLIYSCSKTKAGKALLGFIEDECNRRFRGTPEDSLLAGKNNLHRDLLDLIEEGKHLSNG